MTSPAQFPKRKKMNTNMSINKKAYAMRKKGVKWIDIAKQLKMISHAPAQLAAGLVCNYCRREGLPWPVEIE